MKKRICFIEIVLALLVIHVQQSFCCTSFCLRDHKKIIVGNNKGDNVNYEYWMINKRNVKKTAIFIPTRNEI
jgi:hypothetical protein